MGDEKLRFFPLIIDRWVAGTRFLGSSVQETYFLKGVYLDLLIYLYEGGGAIKDEAHISRITGLNPRTSRRIWPELRSKFARNQHGFHHKLVTELLRNGGKLKNLRISAEGSAEAVHFPLRSSNSNTPTYSPSPTPRDNGTNPRAKKTNQRTKQKRFVRPSVQEVASYVSEMGYHIDPEEFVSHYDANGWVRGKTPMRCWKSACTTWERRWRKENQPRSNDYGRGGI